MPAVVMQFVSHPRPGSDLATILQLAKDGDTLEKARGRCQLLVGDRWRGRELRLRRSLR
jgi:hypothetical protein